VVHSPFVLELPRILYRGKSVYDSHRSRSMHRFVAAVVAAAVAVAAAEPWDHVPVDPRRSRSCWSLKETKVSVVVFPGSLALHPESHSLSRSDIGIPPRLGRRTSCKLTSTFSVVVVVVVVVVAPVLSWQDGGGVGVGVGGRKERERIAETDYFRRAEPSVWP
jgi:hypothetical protein